MSTVVDTLVTEYHLHAQNYNSNAASVVNSTAMMEEALTGVVAAAAIVGTALVGVGSAYAKMLSDLSSKGADFEQLKLSLESVTGGADEAAAAMERLHKIAKAPGIGEVEAIQAFRNLKGTGLPDNLNYALIEGFANANARAGGGAGEFDAIMRQVMQIASKPYLQQEDLLILLERGIPMSLFQTALGTTDTDELKRQGVTGVTALREIVDELMKLPKVEGGFKNTVENFHQAMAMAAAQAGLEVNKQLSKGIDDATSDIEGLTQIGYFKSVMIDLLEPLKGFEGTGDMVLHLAAALKIFSVGISETADMVRATITVMGAVMSSMYNSIPAPLRDFIGKATGFSQIADYGASINAYAAMLRSQMDRAEAGGAPGDFGSEEGSFGGGSFGGNSEAKKHTKLLERAVNAAESQLKIQRKAFGGGNAGANGVTANELSSHSSNIRGSRHMVAVMDAFGRLVAEEVDNRINNSRQRQGSFAR